MGKENKVEETGKEEKGLLEDLGLEETTETPEKKEEEIKETEETEEKQEEKKTEETEEKKEETEDKETKEEEVTEEKEEEELEEKDLSKEEIEKLPKDAKGLYYAMKQEREKRKAIEGELQFLKLQNKYNKDKPKDKKESDEETVEDINEILKDKADDDLLSAGELKRILAAQNKKVEKEKKVILDKQREHEERVKRIDEIEDIFKETHPDYKEMLNIFTRAANEMPSLRYEIMAEINRENGNPAKKAYELGKKFKSLYGENKDNGKTKENNAARILKNAEKKKTSASVPGSNISKEALEEMDIEELQKTLSSMSMAEFMKVPKKLRNKALTG